MEFRSPQPRDGFSGERRSQVLAVLTAALEAVEPGKAVRSRVRREGDTLRVGETPYDLTRRRHLYVIGAGKAAGPMAGALEDILGDHLTAGAINVPQGSPATTRTVRVTEAAHPAPDENGVAGTRRIVEIAERATEDDLVLCAVSGGGSALLTLPVEGVALNDVRVLTDRLLKSGATIHDVNAVRKHLDRVKGGGLARMIAPARTASLVLSDVVGNALDVIASGPTAPDASTFEHACGVLDRYRLWGQTPAPVVAWLKAGRAGKHPETPKPGDPIFERVQNVLVGSNVVAAEAAVARATEGGFNALLLSTEIEGEAREVGASLAVLARRVVYDEGPVRRPACVVLGGETTVTVRGSGKGGRNQEVALSAAVDLAGLDDVLVVCLATDGTDGPTDAAGALADGTTLERARALGLEPAAHLADNDAYPFFEALGDLLITGPTHTNVNDLAFVFAW